MHRLGGPSQKSPGLVEREPFPALVNHASAFFLKLDKNGIAVPGNPVAAQPQLFLIGRLFDRGADQPVVIGVIIDIADGVPAVLVDGHPVREHPAQGVKLSGFQQIFLFRPFKGGNDRHRVLLFPAARIRRRRCFLWFQNNPAEISLKKALQGNFSLHR